MQKKSLQAYCSSSVPRGVIHCVSPSRASGGFEAGVQVRIYLSYHSLSFWLSENLLLIYSFCNFKIRINEKKSVDFKMEVRLFKNLFFPCSNILVLEGSHIEHINEIPDPNVKVRFVWYRSKMVSLINRSAGCCVSNAKPEMPLSLSLSVVPQTPLSLIPVAQTWTSSGHRIWD